MKPRFLLARLPSALLPPALLAAALLPTPAAEESAITRPQQIAELEVRIAELTRQLDDLKREEAKNPSAPTFPTNWADALHWRCVGPAAMGGRIVAVSVYEADPSVYWIATASGGLLKTSNNGVTYEHQFDHEATVSVGDVCVAPSNKDVVWVGTGENNPRNSVSWGDGVYKSTDGGKTWKNMGLRKSFQVGKIIVHPKNPDVVYVGALGRLYGPSEERGLFKTTDGGKTWAKILYVDDKTGVIDMRMHPTDPETLLVATWDRQRDGFDSHRGEPPVAEGYDPYDPARKWGPGGGIHKTTDGGKTWKKVGKGLPTNETGRIGLDWYRKDPNVVYAIIDCQKIGMGTPPKVTFLGVQGEDVDGKVRLAMVSDNSPAAKGGLKVGDVVTHVNKEELKAYAALVERVQKGKGGDKLTFALLRGGEAKDVEVTLEERDNVGEGGSKTRPHSFWYGGQRENVQDRQGPNGFEFGGVYRSADAGESWTRVNSVNPRPMYFSQVRVDPSDEKYLYVLGITLYRSKDGGKTFKDDGGNGVHPDQHCLWIDPRDGRHMIVGCDGGVYVTYDRMDHWDFHNNFAIGQFYHVAVDNKKPYHVYGGLQDNGSWGGPSRALDGVGPINEDWIVVGGGDGFTCRVDPLDPDTVYWTSQDGNMGRRNLRTGERAFLRPGGRGQGGPNYRFNWSTPFILSGHNPRIFYAGGNYVFRSLKQGTEAKVISPEITRTKRGTATALAESPRNPDVLWAGTDDGALWVTRDGGVKWDSIDPAKVGLPGPRWVASIEASRYVEGRCYVVFDGHRSDDDEPYVFVTEDFGKTWKSLRNGLPTGSTRVLREDLENPDVLYLGTEFAVWASVSRGAAWTKINGNLPTVAVHELAQHAGSGEMVAATHGRSLWIVDVTPLRRYAAKPTQVQASLFPAGTQAAATLFRPSTATHYHTEPGRISSYGDGSRRFVGENPPRGAVIHYALGKKAENVSLKVVDYAGKTVAALETKKEPGLYTAAWSLTVRQEGSPGPGPGGRGPRRTEPAPPGMYRVVLTVDGEELSQGIKVEADPTLPPGTPTVAEEEAAPKKRRAGHEDD